MYWDDTTSTWIELTDASSNAEWDKWYDYDNKQWANAKSKDGSMWVWIPRYEYMIDEDNTSIAVNFVKTTQTTPTSGYIMHPAFIDDSANNFDNGGWDKELAGFWMAKYEAGFQNATQGETAKTVVNSNLKYTTVNSTSNYLTATITANSTLMSYPVFKANTYSYNNISVGDAYLLSLQIDSAESFYGLSGVDSHLVKNSEWGAVAYLAHSKYGVNGNSTNMNEVEINSKNLSNSIYVNGATSGTKAYVYAVTSYGASDTPNDIDASTTKNMTGVFDMSGGMYERTAGFYKGGAASTTAWHSDMADATDELSTKYVTLYSSNNKKGDATNETSGWNSDYSNFVTAGSPVFLRGGAFNSGSNAGVFSFSNFSGGPNISYGFRSVLVR